MKRLALIVATLSIVATLAGCATVGRESPAASPNLGEDRTALPRAQQQVQTP